MDTNVIGRHLKTNTTESRTLVTLKLPKTV